MKQSIISFQPEKIDIIAKQCVEIYKKETSQNHELAYLKNQLSETIKAINNLMSAIEQGIILKTTKARLAELEQSQEKLEFEIELCKVKHPKLTEKHIKFMLSQFVRQTDDSLEKYNKDIIECFINAIYLYDDKLIVTYNLTNEKSELESSDISLLYHMDLASKNPLISLPITHSPPAVCSISSILSFRFFPAVLSTMSSVLSFPDIFFGISYPPPRK